MFDFWAFLRKKWSEYSNSRGQRGTVIDDLAVKPAGLVLSDFYNALSEQRRINNISLWETMTDAELNIFGNKFFLGRIEGDFSTGLARIYFNEKKNIEISTIARFVSNSGLQYRPTQPGKISGSSFLNSTNRIALYYINIPIIAVSKGDEYNTDANEITQLINIEFTYHSVTNPENIIRGSKYETNEEYFNRLVYAINDRSMMNKKSMIVLLPEFFPVINAMYIAGSGDRYMQRDLITGVDLSIPFKKADYLGKLNGENIVKHIGWYGIFPPNVGSLQSDRYWGPHSAVSDYRYPLTIEQSSSAFNPDQTDPRLSDPAFLGFPLDQECTDDMYKGLFFNDYKRLMEVSTNDLYNIDDENIGFESVLPNSDEWRFGAHGMKPGNFGRLSDDAQNINVINMYSNEIRLAGGAYESISLGRDILKRTGVKLTGSFIYPDPGDDPESDILNSNLQIMVGGINDANLVDGYTGVGFGVRMVDIYDDGDIDTPNAVIYFAHNEKYGTAQVYATDFDISDHISVSDIGALAEKEFRIQPGIEYEFEFIIYDDLRVSLYLYKTSEQQPSDPDEKENELHFELPRKVLGIFSDPDRNGLLSPYNNRYGTTMKVTLDTETLVPEYVWRVNNLKAFDMNPSAGMALYAINMDGIESPAFIFLRAYGRSAISGSSADGYQAFIWDKEVQTAASGSSELTRGGWSEANGISNPDSSKSIANGLLRHNIANLDRYLVDSKYGKNIFIMIITTGKSKGSIRYNGDVRDDIHSLLRIDYIKVESANIASYHANNKADIHLATLNNSEEYEIVTTTIVKQPIDTYFEMSLENDCKMPVVEIVSITIGTTVSDTEALAETEYTIINPDPIMINSSKEKKHIVLNESDADVITVEYRTYPEIERIQDFFEGSIYQKIYGDVLVKHKIPCDLSFTIFYTGDINDDQLITEIRKYVDDNIDGVFSIRNFISYLYNEELVNNVQEPIEISYTKWNNEWDQEMGTFTDELAIRTIDFFRIVNLNVQKL